MQTWDSRFQTTVRDTAVNYKFSQGNSVIATVLGPLTKICISGITNDIENQERENPCKPRFLISLCRTLLLTVVIGVPAERAFAHLHIQPSGHRLDQHKVKDTSQTGVSHYDWIYFISPYKDNLVIIDVFIRPRLFMQILVIYTQNNWHSSWN